MIIINICILYFKHITHTVDFPLNGFPDSVMLFRFCTCTITVCQECAKQLACCRDTRQRIAEMASNRHTCDHVSRRCHQHFQHDRGSSDLSGCQIGCYPRVIETYQLPEMRTHHISRCGVPAVLILDNGPQYQAR